VISSVADHHTIIMTAVEAKRAGRAAVCSAHSRFTSNAYGHMDIVVWCRAASSLQPIFGRGGGALKDRLYSEAEVAAALDSYAASNSLQVPLPLHSRAARRHSTQQMATCSSRLICKHLQRPCSVMWSFVRHGVLAGKGSTFCASSISMSGCC